MHEARNDYGMPYASLDERVATLDAQAEAEDRWVPVSDWRAAGLIGFSAVCSVCILIYISFLVGWLKFS